MSHQKILVRPSSEIWKDIAAMLAKQFPSGLKNVRIVVPTVAHAALLRKALLEIATPLRARGVSTLSALLGSQEPDATLPTPVSDKKRLVSLYEQLREFDWLKKLFTARHNADLFPLAQTLLSLGDELTAALLPTLVAGDQDADVKWERALSQLPPNVRDMLTDESQLVWAVWKTQLDSHDSQSVKYAQMLKLAEDPQHDLVWISSVDPTPIECSFLQNYSATKSVIEFGLDWASEAVEPAFAQTWPELLSDEHLNASDANVETPPNLSIVRAVSLEDEAQQGAQAVVDWVAEGKTNLAIIAQDRVVARRIRALLERAKIYVADETGWKLSTTPAAAAVMATLDASVAASKSRAALSLLKCSFIFAAEEGKVDHIMTIEGAIRKGNIKGGWSVLKESVADYAGAYRMVEKLQIATADLQGSKTMSEWSSLTLGVLGELGMAEEMTNDPAGSQVVALLAQLTEMFESGREQFTIKEWRKFLTVQFEGASFVPPGTDTRVVMLPLNGARLRSFDAVLVIGADSKHLPSQVHETMFFANAVRRELGLSTREMLQRQQLRDLTEVLQSGAVVKLTYQGVQGREIVAVSPWIERLQLTLECAGKAPVPSQRSELRVVELQTVEAKRPAPAAAALYPQKMSPSGHNSLMGCPYQYLLTRLMGLKPLDDLTEMAEKRNYGEWLHEILNDFHTTIRDQSVTDRAALLEQLTVKVFTRELVKSPASLGYLARWRKVMPVYLQWQADRESKGWHFYLGEHKLQKLLEFEGGTILVEGTLDRLDRNEQGEFDIPDYKAKSVARLREAVKDVEDGQLPIYGLLPPDRASSGRYVSLEMADESKGDVESVDFSKKMDAVEKRIIQNVIRIRNNEPMPANGQGRACEYCEVAGICRKKSWQYR